MRGSRGSRSGSAAATDRPATRNLGQLRRLAAYLRPYRGTVIGAGIALVVASAAVLSLGEGVRRLVDRGFAARHQGCCSRLRGSFVSGSTGVSTGV